MYEFDISDKLQQKLKKLSKKDKLLHQRTLKKIKEIVNCFNIESYKNLRNNLKNFKRVHIDKSFVLTYEILEDKNVIRLLNYKHHDKIYLK